MFSVLRISLGRLYWQKTEKIKLEFRKFSYNKRTILWYFVFRYSINTNIHTFDPRTIAVLRILFSNHSRSRTLLELLVGHNGAKRIRYFARFSIKSLSRHDGVPESGQPVTNTVSSWFGLRNIRIKNRTKKNHIREQKIVCFQNVNSKISQVLRRIIPNQRIRVSYYYQLKMILLFCDRLNLASVEKNRQ